MNMAAFFKHFACKKNKNTKLLHGNEALCIWSHKYSIKVHLFTS